MTWREQESFDYLMTEEGTGRFSFQFSHEDLIQIVIISWSCSHDRFRLENFNISQDRIQVCINKPSRDHVTWREQESFDYLMTEGAREVSN